MVVDNASYLRLTSNNATAGNRTIALTDGLATGQILYVECTGPTTNKFEFMDDAAGHNTNVVVARSMAINNVIQFIWNGTDWLEVSYSAN